MATRPDSIRRSAIRANRSATESRVAETGGACGRLDRSARESSVTRCRAYIFPGVTNVPVDVSAHAQ